ncbi:MAG TPA: 5-deoxy-glucuronate isomerase [Acidothermaceae bacterium]
MRTVISPGKDTDLIELGLAELAVGESLEKTSDDETLVVVLSGVVDVECDGRSLGRAGSRANVFEASGDAVYAPPGSTLAFTVRDNDAAAIKSGYHPVVGAPGYSLYYLWVMAGRGRQMIPAFDPRHAWVQAGR